MFSQVLVCPPGVRETCVVGAEGWLGASMAGPMHAPLPLYGWQASGTHPTGMLTGYHPQMKLGAR